MKATIRYDSEFVIPGTVCTSVQSGGIGRLYVELNTQQARELLFNLADQLGLKVTGEDNNDKAKIDPAFLSSCPTGHETLIGYMARRGFDIDESFAAGWGKKLRAMVRDEFEKDYQPVLVDAPQVLHEDNSGMRIEQVYAYRTHILDYFFNTRVEAKKAA